MDIRISLDKRVNSNREWARGYQALMLKYNVSRSVNRNQKEITPYVYQHFNPTSNTTRKDLD